jgi:chromosome partitioning protein
MNIEHPRGIVIAVGNQKGGVGKTTVCVHIAAALGLRGYRCLIVDLDPAAGATRHLGVPENSFAGSLELLTTDERLEALAVTENLPKNVHLIPSRPQLSELETLLSKFVDRTTILERPIAVARQLYDYVLLDTPPSAAAITTVAAYATAEWFLLSAFPHPLSLGGLSEALSDIADVRTFRNPELEVLGVVFNNVDGRATRLRSELDNLVQRALPGRAFRTQISQAVIVPTLSGKGRTLFQLARHNEIAVACQYKRLAAEIERRVLNRDEFLSGTLATESSSSALRLVTGNEQTIAVGSA